MSNDQFNNIRDQVLDRIERGDVTQKPRWYFLLHGALFFLGVLLVTLTLLFVSSFIVFSLYRNGLWFMPGFGWRGLGVFLWSLPWLLVLLATIFVIVLEVLVHRYAFAYRRPLLISAFGVVAIGIVGGFLLAQTSLHRTLLVRAKHHTLPLAGPFYREYGESKFSNVHVGEVQEVVGNRFMLRTPTEEVFTVILTPETRLPFGINFAMGDNIVVFGDQVNRHIEAVGIRRIERLQVHRNTGDQRVPTLLQ